jgi:predicted NBD/HSP70 family sugar kinase
MKKLTNQSVFRERNLKAVINLLKNENMTSRVIAGKLNLSIVATDKIIEELIELNLVESVIESNTNKRGRPACKYIYSPKKYCVAAIDLSTKKIKWNFSTLDLKILSELVYEDIPTITENILKNIVMDMKKQADKLEKEGYILQNITISSPGKISKKTHIIAYAPRFEKVYNIDIISFFQKYFTCQLFLDNDINLALIGEMNLGCSFENITDAIYMQLDYGIGGSLLLNSKIYYGANGFSGEFGLVKAKKENNRLINLGGVCSVSGMLERYEKKTGKGISYHKFLELYNDKNSTVLELVNDSINNLAIFCYDIVNIFDTEIIVLGGAIRNFGNYYIEKLDKEFLKLKEMESYEKIVFSDCVGDVKIMGAIHFSVTQAINKIIKERKNNNVK